MSVEIIINHPEISGEEIGIVSEGRVYAIGPARDLRGLGELSDDELRQAGHLIDASLPTWERRFGDRYLPAVRGFEDYCNKILGVQVKVL